MSESSVNFDRTIYEFKTLKYADDKGSVKEYPEIRECILGDGYNHTPKRGSESDAASGATYRVLQTRDVEDGTKLFVLYEGDFRDRNGKICGWSEICGRHLTMSSVNNHVELLERMKADKAKVAEIEKTGWER